MNVYFDSLVARSIYAYVGQTPKASAFCNEFWIKWPSFGRWKLNLDVVTIGNLPSISRCAVKPVRGQLLGKLDKFPFEECSK